MNERKRKEGKRKEKGRRKNEKQRKRKKKKERKEKVGKTMEKERGKMDIKSASLSLRLDGIISVSLQILL